MRKLTVLRRILRGATPIDLGLSVAIAVVVAVTAWGASGQGSGQPISASTAVHA